jgi:hypothetical protein
VRFFFLLLSAFQQGLQICGSVSMPGLFLCVGGPLLGLVSLWKSIALGRIVLQCILSVL